MARPLSASLGEAVVKERSPYKQDVGGSKPSAPTRVR